MSLIIWDDLEDRCRWMQMRMLGEVISKLDRHVETGEHIEEARRNTLKVIESIACCMTQSTPRLDWERINSGIGEIVDDERGPYRLIFLGHEHEIMALEVTNEDGVYKPSCNWLYDEVREHGGEIDFIDGEVYLLIEP